MPLLPAIARRIERFEALDGIAHAVTGAASRVIGHGRAKNLLSGGWVGHQLHPMLTDLPIGFFTSAVALDLVGGRDGAHAARRLTTLGLLSVPPTALAGLSDHADSYGGEARVGLVHAAANGTASALFALSLVAPRPRPLRLAGLSMTLASAYLGGYLTLERGVGVSHIAFEQPSTEWQDMVVDGAEPLDEGAPRRGSAGGVALVVYRLDGVTYAISDTCSHAGGPLHEGDVDGDLCITCPWHGSRFRLVDGEVASGPASVGQTAFDVREREGVLQARARA